MTLSLERQLQTITASCAASPVRSPRVTSASGCHVPLSWGQSVIMGSPHHPSPTAFRAASSSFAEGSRTSWPTHTRARRPPA
jgi:hypothetical protein